jgi:hypothetical protein
MQEREMYSIFKEGETTVESNKQEESQKTSETN